AFTARSGAGWFEGRIQVGSIRRGCRGQAIKTRHVLDVRDDVLRGCGGDMGEAMATMCRAGAGSCLVGAIVAALCDRDRWRSLVAIEATAGMEQGGQNGERDDRG